MQVESQCEESGLVISGFYHGHDNLRDNHVDVFSQKIADKVRTSGGLSYLGRCTHYRTTEYRPAELQTCRPTELQKQFPLQIAENQPGSLLVTIDSKKLSVNIESHCLIVQQNIEGGHNMSPFFPSCLIASFPPPLLPSLFPPSPSLPPLSHPLPPKLFLLASCCRQVADPRPEPGAAAARPDQPGLRLRTRPQEDLQVRGGRQAG